MEVQMGRRLHSEAAKHRASVGRRIEVLAEMARMGRQEPRFRRDADEIRRVAAGSNAKLAAAIYDYVAGAFAYRKDDPGVDVFSPARVAVARGYGDCDEQTQLVGTMASLLGLPVKIIAVSFRDDGQFGHVYPKVYINGRWVTIDVTARRGPGYEVPGRDTMETYL